MTERQIHKVALAAGGTGGHLFPAQALAGALLGRGIEVMLLTDRRGGGFGQDLPDIEVHIVASGGIPASLQFSLERRPTFSIT